MRDRKMNSNLKCMSVILAVLMTSMVSVLGAGAGRGSASPQPVGPAAYNQSVSDVIDNVSSENLYTYIYDLQNFTTRFFSTPNLNQSGQYIYDHFSNYSSLAVESQYLSYGGEIVRNIIATLPAFNPTNKSVYVIGGHYDSVCYDAGPPACDSFSNPMDPAPGADDDASGTALVMEAARILSKYKFNATIVFAAWTTEELGLIGSDYYARKAFDSGVDVDGMLQFDMIGYDPAGPLGLDVITDVPSQSLADKMISIVQDYGIGLVINKIIDPTETRSDHASFWAQGYPAVMSIESSFSAYYHSPNDTVDKLNMGLVWNTSKTGIGALAELAGIFTPGVGTIVLDKVEYTIPETVGISLYDPDLNIDQLSAEVVSVTASSNTEPLGESVMLTETGTNTSVFNGSIVLTDVPTTGQLEVVHDDIITVSYDDLSPPGTRTATAVVDDMPPVISDVTIFPGAASAIVSWKTDEEADSEVFYNVSEPLDLTKNNSKLVVSHSLELMGLSPSTRYYLDVASTDIAGNGALDDNGGLHYSFETLSGIMATPDYGYVGYVQSDELTGNHFASERMIVGHSDYTGRTYVGGAQFDTSAFSIPPTATVTNATVSLYNNVWIYNEAGGQWTMRLLHSSIDADWPYHNYQNVTSCPVNATLSPSYANGAFVDGEWTVFWFNPATYAELVDRVNTGKVSFRMDGPTFASVIYEWATGYTVSGEPRAQFAPKLTISYSLTGDTTGPAVTGLTATPNPTWGAGLATFDATVTDAATGGSNVSYAEYFITADPGVGNAIALPALDGGFDSVSEDVSFALDVSAWAPGQYAIHVRGRDSSGNWGPAEQVLLTVLPPDTALPEIANIAAVPDPQEVHGFVNVSADITDNDAVSGVWLNVSMPDGSWANDTMPNFLDNYYNESAYHLLGTHGFIIWAVDPVNNWNSTSGSFQVVDSSVPTISNLVDSPDPQMVFGSVNVTANVTDNFAVDEVWIDISGTGNFSMTFDPASGLYFYEASYSNLDTYSYTVWANDTSDNWNGAAGSFLIVDPTIPAISNLAESPDPQEVFGSVNVTANVTDNFAVGEVWIDISGTGNFSMAFDPVSGLYFHEASYSSLNAYPYVIWANDTEDNWNSATGSFSIVDTTAPTISDLAIVPAVQEVHGSVVVSTNVTDNYALSGVWIELVPPTGPSSNVSMTAGTGNSFFLDQIYDVVGVHTFTIWANDTSGNWQSVSGSFTVQDTTPPVVGAAMTIPNPQEVHGNVNVSVSATDNYALATVSIEIIAPNSTVLGNFTMLYNGSTSLYYYIAGYDSLGLYSFEIWASDSEGNNATTTGTFSITDTENPSISHDPVTGGKAGEGIDVKVSVSDNDAVKKVTILYTDVNGAEYNESMLLSGGQYVFTIPAQDGAGIVKYTIWAQDEGGNVASTQEYEINIEGGSQSWTWILILLAVVIVAVLIILLLLWRRKKDGARKEEGAEERAEGAGEKVEGTSGTSQEKGPDASEESDED